MGKQTPKTVYLKNYLPPDYLVDSIALRFELDEAQTLVTASMKIQSRETSSGRLSELLLYGKNLELLSLKLNNVTLHPEQYSIKGETLTLLPTESEFTLDIETRIYPQNNTALEGLYKSNQMFCTQCEAEGFRTITYYPDRPDVMASFTVTIVANKERYPVLLSNGNLIEQGELDNDRHWVTWHDPFKKPSYLFALVAGNLAVMENNFTTVTGRNISLRIFVEPENIKKCDHAMASLKKAMRWDEEVYGLEYDLDIYMIVAVGDFNMGAMENKGLNIFNTVYVLAEPDTATDSDYIGIEGVIGHEYFHNWTGNRVTCRDWFQLSLKEGLTVFRDQEFSADMGLRSVKRIDDVRLLRAYQFPEDAGPMAHSVRPGSYMEINNFYTMTVYNKGAEVIRMYQTLLGKDGFRRGMDLYFERHDGNAVTTDDFCAAMADANNTDLSQFKRWYDQAGTPVVSIASSFDKSSQTYTLTVHQFCPATPGQESKKPFVIPIEIALLNNKGEPLPLIINGKLNNNEASDGIILTLNQEEQQFVFEGIKEKPIPSFLRGFSAPVILQYEFSRSELGFLMTHDNDEFNRWEASQKLYIGFLLDQIDDSADQDIEMDASLINAIGHVLHDDILSPAIATEVLRLPSEAYLGEQISPADVDAIHNVRQKLKIAVARHFKPDLLAIYQSLHDKKPYQFSSKAVGRRRLKNLCLSYLMEVPDQDVMELCISQFEHSQHMTDVLAALSCLSHIDSPMREQALTDFYQRWQQDPLVVNKWLSLQASSRLPNALETVKRLLEHPAFDIKNPNKVRALIGSFCRNNMVHFHNQCGAGYVFLAEQVLRIDRFNPQIAARLLAIMSTWKKYDESRQILIKQQLNKVLQCEALSKDCYEVASKSLMES